MFHFPTIAIFYAYTKFGQLYPQFQNPEAFWQYYLEIWCEFGHIPRPYPRSPSGIRGSHYLNLGYAKAKWDCLGKAERTTERFIDLYHEFRTVTADRHRCHGPEDLHQLIDDDINALCYAQGRLLLLPYYQQNATAFMALYASFLMREQEDDLCNYWNDQWYLASHFARKAPRVLEYVEQLSPRPEVPSLRNRFSTL